MAFVSRSEANAVDVFDPAKMQLVARIPIAEDPDSIFFDPRTKVVYVASGDGNMGTIIDPARRSVVAAIPLGGKPEYAAIDTGMNLLMQNIKSTNEVVSVDLEKHVVTKRTKLDGCEGPSGMAIDVPDRRLFIACSTNSKLLVLGLDDHRILTMLPIGGTPDSIAFDPGVRRIYTAGRVGVTSIVQQDTPDSYRIVDTIKTHYGAHSLTVDPATHRVYIGYASLLTQPRIAVFDAMQ